MKKQLLGIITIAIWLLAWGSSFAQEAEYPFCSQVTNWIISCQEKQICNNPGAVCRCKIAASPFNYATEHIISHNTSCLANTELVKKKIISSYAVSGSIVTFEFTVQNNSTAKTFELRLPTAGQNPRINITNININDDDWSCNWWSIGLNWFLTPSCYIHANKTALITITGEIVSSSLIFDNITTNTCIKNIGSNACIDSERTTTTIFPTTNYSISQRLLDPKPVFGREQAIYEIIVQNNWSKISNQNIRLSSILSSFLSEAQLLSDNNVVNGLTPNSWELGQIPSWTTKTYLMNATLMSTPPAWTVIITTGQIAGWNEFMTSDNIATTTYTIPRFLDLQVEKVEKMDENPEISWNMLRFSIWYKNRWNETMRDVIINAFVDWINLNINNVSLPDLDPNTTWKFIITWLIDQNFPIGTNFCLSWSISASNETEETNNNSFSGICYMFVKSADLAVEAELENQINTISSWSTINYKIKISNLWQKTANNIRLRIFPSANQHPSTATILSGITLWSGEQKEINYSSIIRSYPVEWTSISLSGDISFTGIDLDLTNNTFDIKYDLPALSDVYVHLGSLPFSGFRIGDTITYVISYGNSGLASARNPEIRLELPAFVRTDESVRNLWKSMSAGQTWNFLVKGTLTENLAVGTQFTTRARIGVDTAQVTTGNDISVLTSSVIAYDNITFTLTVHNESRQAWNINSWLVRAASGHNIAFTLNYVNNGNVPANNVNISLPNIWPLTITPFNNPETIWIWQQGSVIIQWKINWTNFPTFTPTATISYNNGTNITRSVTIEEPYQCGDWLITRNEQCDTALNINYWTWQVCENQWWACVLTTRFISNTACIQTLDWTEICSEPAIINLHQPRCHEVTVTQQNTTTNTVRCVPQYAFAYTPYRITCWGGADIFTGYVWIGINNSLNMIEKNCTYSNENTAMLAQATCQIGQEITNWTTQPACRRSLPSCDIDVDAPIVIVDSDEEWTVDVQCSTRNWQDASLQIFCGNWDRSAIEEDNVMSYTCKYSQDDLDGDGNRIMPIECRVNWAQFSCEDEVLLDIGILGVCGDGKRQGYEQCDLLPNWSEIGRYLDENNSIAPTEYRWKTCHNCSIKDVAPAQCLSVFNENISIEKGEYLPFWWRVNAKSFVHWNSYPYAQNYNCWSNDQQKIIKSSLKCIFEIQKPGEAWEQDTETIYDDWCWFAYPYPWASYDIFNYFSWYMKPDTWAYAVDTKKRNIFDFIGDDLWEYKLRLKEITYDYCDSNLEKQNSQTDNVCETNFTITKPYLVQKSAFGMTPKATNINLKGFQDINGKDIITRTDLADVMVLDDNEYQSNDVDFMVKSFIETAEKLAVKTTTPRWLSNVASAKKVPNKDIYILYGNGSDITLIKDANVTKPFTLIVKNANLVVHGDVNVNGMFVVKNNGNWTIKFKDDNCNKQQIVKWIFIADTFDAIKSNRNDSLEKQRCNAWWLHIKWVLIGWWIENLVEKKRSTLSTWFRVSWSEASKRIQRRNMIFNGASVLIEYSPELWQQLPPGADEFTKMLDVYKK